MTGSGALCHATTAAGFGCINKVKSGLFCPAHDPRNQCEALTATGARCRRTKSYGTDRCSKHQF